MWDLSSSSFENDPETFAEKTCSDLGLPAELEPVIAFKIRESVYL